MIMMELFMPVLFNVADDEQVEQLYESARKILKDNDSPALRLCTPFPETDLNVGRITGFVYGYKEHGSKWMQQNIMFMHALYHRNKLHHADQMFREIYSIAQNSAIAKTFPGIPSFYEPGDRGAYMYLTGSSTWIFLSLVSQVFGVRGENGNLIINPKLSVWFFDDQGKASLEFTFQNQRIKIIYLNQNNLPAGKYNIVEIKADGRIYFSGESKITLINKEFIKSFDKEILFIEVFLG